MYQVPRLLPHRALAALSIAAILASFVCLPVASAATRLRAKPGPSQADKRGQDDSKTDTSSGTAKEPYDEKEHETETLEIRETHNGPGGSLARSTAPTTSLTEEVEPNGTSATATPIAGSSARVRGNIFANGDIDFYSFSGTAGDRVYIATMTQFSASASVDSFIDLIQPDGTTVLEADNDDGSFGTTSSSIAGRALTMSGTHFIRVRHNLATSQLRPYDLYFQLRTGAPTAETESNNTFPGQVIPASGWISGSSAAADPDFFAVNLNAGDTVFLSLDPDPERDTVTWNPRLGLGQFGAFILLVNDASVTSPNSEAYFMTVRTTGTYGIFVDAAAGTGTYHLSATVFPRINRGTCTTYTSTNVPQTIPAGAPPITVDSTLTVPGNPRIDQLRVNINLTHTFMSDLDVELVSPDGSTIGLFSDIGPSVAGAATMNLTLDDDAAIPPSFTVVDGMVYQPELAYRLGWRAGSNAGGTWTLRIRDDATGDGGTLNGWSLEICENPQPLCGGSPTNIVYSADFETNDGGFTHSGVQDEWERGLPTFAPVTGANSGTNAWKTDLDSGYNASASQDLLSPNIVLPAVGPIRLSWAQKYHIESATFDHANVTIREVGNPANSRLLWQFLDATMNNTVGSTPAVTVNEAAGWGICERDISDFAGLTVEVLFHLDSDTTVQLAGWAIDDVMVESCGGCVITCPANVVQANDANQCGAVVNYPAPTDNMMCGPIVCSPASGSFFPVGTTTVTCMEDIILQDPEGNPIPSCSFTVTVQDTQAPAITCPANVTQSNDANQCGAVVTFAAPTVSDNCPGVGTPACTPTSGSFFPVGTTTVTCTVADASPDSVDGTCSFTVTVNDTQAPTITCPANVTQGNDANQCGAVVNYTAPTASDNCPGVGVVCTPAAGSFFPVGTTSVSCTATDATGNTATCGFTVTVNDTQAPTITCPANIVTSGTDTATCALSGVVNYPAPTVSDNCPGVGVPVCVPASGSTFPEGTTTVTCTVADAAGNTATCSFTVTVTSVGAFGACAVDDFSGDTWSIVTDPNSPIFRFWRYRVAATGEVFCGTASAMAYIPNRSLTASDNDDPTLFMNANLNYGARAGTVKVVDRATGRQFVIKDRNLNNNPPCQ